LIQAGFQMNGNLIQRPPIASRNGQFAASGRVSRPRRPGRRGGWSASRRASTRPATVSPNNRHNPDVRHPAIVATVTCGRFSVVFLLVVKFPPQPGRRNSVSEPTGLRRPIGCWPVVTGSGRSNRYSRGVLPMSKRLFLPAVLALTFVLASAATSEASVLKRLFARHHGHGCCEPACCEPACCEPACCAPACYEPACCEPACCEPACCPRRHCGLLRGLLSLFHWHRCHSCCEPACCEPACCVPEPSCRCGY
jgi:hypothetical protein